MLEERKSLTDKEMKVVQVAEGTFPILEGFCNSISCLSDC
jgi:hypothetical protein